MLDTLMEANRQWSTRPDDERFVNLYAMKDHFDQQRANSRAVVTGVTAYARGLAYQDARVELETEAGKILQMA